MLGTNSNVGWRPRVPLAHIADNLTGMMRGLGWLAISVALSLTGVACSRTPMNAIGTGGGGMTDTTGEMTSSPGGTTSAPGGVTSSPGETTSSGGTVTAGGTGESGSGGSSSSGGTSLYGGTPPSCRGLAATCGPSGNDDCCTSLMVPGGTFYRSYDDVDLYGHELPGDGD